MPCLLDKVKVTREESFAWIREIVASAIACLAAVSINFPFMLPSAFWAKTVTETDNSKAMTAKIFLISNSVYTNLDVLRKNSLRYNVKRPGNVMSEEKDSGKIQLWSVAN